ncbi:MAG: transposase [Firmicutes bacterium]|nr:transposase [Bacillota bacterium]
MEDCGIRGPVRTHICKNCGLVIDCDHNAAVNILKRAS